MIASVVLHVIAAAIAWRTIGHLSRPEVEDVDIELAPIAPRAEALPEEVATKPDDDLGAVAGALGSKAEEATDTSGVAPGAEGLVADAGVDAARPDAAIDAAKPDAAIDAARPDAAVDAATPDAASDAAKPDAAIDAPLVAVNDDASLDAAELAVNSDAAAVASTRDATELAVIGDAAVAANDDAPQLAVTADAGVDAPQVAAVRTPDNNGSAAGSGSRAVATAGSGSGTSSAGSGAGSGSGGGGTQRDPDGSLATVAGSGSGKPGAENLPAVDGDATQTPGTAANLLAYFPKGQVVAALIRFDRLRGNEWGEATEKILKPLPDYQSMFGDRDARLADRFDTLVIASPRPHDATATILVGKTAMSRPMLRDYLAKNTKVAWSATKGGLLGRRTSRIPRDQRVFLSPFTGWFLLADPADLGAATDASSANPDRCELTGPAPAWLSQIRKIRDESGGDKPGPALVLTMAFDGAPLPIGKQLGLGIASIPTPQRLSLAMEVVKGGWLIRGNMLFATEAAATAFVASAKQAQRTAASSSLLKGFAGRNLENFINNLSFSQGGDRVSYATSISVADARAMLAVAALKVDDAFRKQPLPP